ncbi:MAG: RNA polymerase factor sigma-32, partial [Beijerinckiaceae bacterium]|nr:RNA polymerase factor sigma-32 [Beijerinckiaceae bacterium]
MAQLAEVAHNLLAAAVAAPYLERDEEYELASRWKRQADEKAMHVLARAHFRLVIALAVRFRHYGLSLADLIQEGNVGLMEAAARFEPDREVRFSTYATWWIRAAMQNYILHNWSIVRGGTSSAQKALFFNLRRIRAKLAQGGNAAAGSDVFNQIAGALGVSLADVENMNARLSGPDLSLNAPLGDADPILPQERMVMLVDDKPRPDEAAGASIDAGRRVAWLQEALAALSERERKILRERRLAEETGLLEYLAGNLDLPVERLRLSGGIDFGA